MASPSFRRQVGVPLGAVAEAQRRAMELLQVQLYERTRATPGYISKIEQGHSNPSLEMMLKLAGAVGLELWAMLHQILRLTRLNNDVWSDGDETRP